MGIVIDTSVLVTLERAGRSWDDLLSGLKSGTEDDPFVAIAAITVSELLVGVLRADSKSRRALRGDFVEQVIGKVTVLSFDLASARVHARVWAGLSGSGETIGPSDLLIAATALANGHAVLTENFREFQRVPDLDVLAPLW